MQTYICEVCGRTAHTTSLTIFCAHCGGFLASERRPAQDTDDIEFPDLQIMNR